MCVEELKLCSNWEQFSLLELSCFITLTFVLITLAIISFEAFKLSYCKVFTNSLDSVTVCDFLSLRDDAKLDERLSGVSSCSLATTHSMSSFSSLNTISLRTLKADWISSWIASIFLNWGLRYEEGMLVSSWSRESNGCDISFVVSI